jgi:hypothetical protein
MALLVSGLENGKHADGLPDATMQTSARTEVFDFISSHGECDEQKLNSS